MSIEFSPLSEWMGPLKKPLVIAGPCSAETPDQVLEVAKNVSQFEEVKIFRAGIWKPRTRPGSFEGIGSVGLPWLEEVKKEYNLKISTEVATPDHIELALKHNVDILWIGARTSANPFSVQALADVLKGVDIPVFVKNPINADLSLWIGALERFSKAGVRKMGAVHRGFSMFEKSFYRNPPMWEIPIELKRRYPNLPIICDPSHITGDRNNIARVCQKAMDLNMDGLMIETHPTPDKAWSDAAQQVTPNELKEILSHLSLRDKESKNFGFEQELQALRDKIDRVDKTLIDSLEKRNDIVQKIAEAKHRNNVTPLQLDRMDQVMKERQAWAIDKGLPERFASELFKLIHEESVRTQTNIMNKFSRPSESDIRTEQDEDSLHEDKD